jgi:hypothetical protein
MGSLLVEEAHPVRGDDAGFRRRVELLAIEALITEAGVKGFDVAVLPGRIGVDVEGADVAIDQTVADGAGDKLGAVRSSRRDRGLRVFSSAILRARFSSRMSATICLSSLLSFSSVRRRWASELVIIPSYFFQR